MPPKRRAPAKDSSSEPKRKKKIGIFDKSLIVCRLVLISVWGGFTNV